MNRKECIIDINEANRPYNTYLVLPLPLLQELMPLLFEEIMLGLVDTADEESVILHLQLNAHKIAELRKLLETGSRKVA